MSRFHIGDVCQVRSLPDIDPEYRGRECVVLTNLLHVKGLNGARHRIDLQGMEKYRVYASPLVLKRLPPPDVVGSWDECVFKPMIIQETT